MKGIFYQTLTQCPREIWVVARGDDDFGRRATPGL